jgi:hypothetical protein
VKPFAIVLVVLIAAPGLVVPAPVMAAPSMTAEQFAQRCKKSADFCNLGIAVEIATLERSRAACLPGSVSKQMAAAKVQSLFEDVMEEDPESFRASPYWPVIRSIVEFLWPCEPIS